MNERIKQFYEQCNRVVDDPFGGAHISFDHQKFAELIVKECAEVAWINTPDTEELDYSHLISNKIKQHFGVKE